MPPLPLDERIVVIQRPKSLALCVASPPNTSQSSSRFTTRNELPSHSPQPHRPPLRTHPPSDSSSLECKHRHSPNGQRLKGERSANTEDNSWIVSHCHSNGTVTLGPRPFKHTHTINNKVSVDKGGAHFDKKQSVRESKLKTAPSHLISGQSDWAPRGFYDIHEDHQNKTHYINHYQNNLTVSPGGVLEFVPAHRQQSKHKWTEDDFSKSRFTLGNKENTKLGTVHQPPKSHALPYNHSSIPSAHASVLNTHYQSSPNSFRTPSSFHPVVHNRPSRIDEQHTQVLHSLPLSTTSSLDSFPSPDHTCTIDFSQPFACNCWRLICCRQGHSAGCRGGTGNPSASISHRRNPAKRGDGAMGLKTLTGCISTASTTNTSSSNSTVSDCRTGILRPLGCTTCSRDNGSPAVFRKKLVGGCLPCSPFSASSPLRALQSCVSGCNPKASQAGSSTCSYCSSDPIVVTYNPHRGKPPGAGYSTGTIAGYQHDDDDYSVRTIWPDELAKKMTCSKSQPNQRSAGMRMGAGRSYMDHEMNTSNGSPVSLDCRNLLEFNRSQLTDNAGRRRLQQGKMAVLDFMGSARDYGQDSLKRLCNHDGDAALQNDDSLDDMFPNSSFSPHEPPESPSLFSPSAPTTLIKSKPRGREWEGGHSLPSAQSLHLALNSFNREQNDDHIRRKKVFLHILSFYCNIVKSWNPHRNTIN